MAPLPDCPHCDGADTLEPMEVESRGVVVAQCSCCSKRCRINADGEIVHRADVRDVSGVVMEGE